MSAEGWQVTVYPAGAGGHCTREWERQHKIMGYYPVREVSNWPHEEYTVMVDALFGIGLSRPVQGEYAEIIREMNRRKGFKLSVDVPSGIHAATGKVMGAAVRADLTVTFGWAKKGLLFIRAQSTPDGWPSGKSALTGSVLRRRGKSRACFTMMSRWGNLCPPDAPTGIRDL